MRAEPALALLLLAGCGRAPARIQPDPATVDLLVEVQLAEARAALTGADADSAHASALEGRRITPEEFDQLLTRAAGDTEAAIALWEAVAARLDAERLSGPR